MTEQTETSSDEGGEQSIAVRLLVPTRGVTSRQIVSAVIKTLDGHAVNSLSVAVVDDATIGSLHERYMHDASPTDVLSFDLRDDPDDERIGGEIVVSAETAARQARDMGIDEREELLRYVVHGLLHLMGYNDDTRNGRARMRRAEDQVLANLPLRPKRVADRPKTQHKPGRNTGGV